VLDTVGSLQEEARVKPWKVALVIAGAGLAIGVLTVSGQGWLPGEWSTLANSGAVWLVFSFAAGSCMRSDVAAAASGAGVLVCAVDAPRANVCSRSA
jgi:hypothetical protein